MAFSGDTGVAENYIVDAPNITQESDAGTLGTLIGDTFSGGAISRNKAEREAANEIRRYQYEQANLAAARNWDLYVDSTKYQRQVEDLKAAGLNPWLAAQSMGAAGSSQQAPDVNNGSAKSSSKSSNQDKATALAGILGAAAKIIAAVVAA